MTRAIVHVGEPWGRARDRIVDAVERFERGGRVAAETHISFGSLEEMTATLSPARRALVSALHGRPAASVAELARRLGRGYRRVHEDVAALERAGLIERGPDFLLHAPFAGVHVEVDVAFAAE